MNFVRNKKTICQLIIPLLQEKNIDITLDRAMRTWWRNPRLSGGLGLSDRGYDAFTTGELEYYDVDYKAKLFAGGITVLTDLNKKMPCPYYVHINKKVLSIRIYDSRLLVLIQLYGGLEQCLNIIGNKK
jgi:hypothetical protein